MISIKTNFKSQLKNWRDFMVMSLIFVPVMLYLYYQNGPRGLFIFYIFILIDFVFTAYLSIQYYIKNKGEEFTIYTDKIVKIKNGVSVVYYNTDITKIVICKSANMDSWGIPYTTFETFRIARVYLNNGKNFIMTNALEYDIEKPLSILQEVKFERRKGFSFFI